MRNIKTILMLCSAFSFFYVKAQTNLSLIEEKYKQLDSISYMGELERSIAQSSFLKFKERNKSNINEIYDEIMGGINGYTIKFVLRVDIDTTSLKTGNYLIVRDSVMIFDLYCHDKKLNPRYFVRFENNNLEDFGTNYPILSAKYAKQLKSGIKQVLKKNPKYIIDCTYLSNTILYVKNEKLYVYRVIQKEVYELDDYVAKFKDSKAFYVSY